MIYTSKFEMSDSKGVKHTLTAVTTLLSDGYYQHAIPDLNIHWTSHWKAPDDDSVIRGKAYQVLNPVHSKANCIRN